MTDDERFCALLEKTLMTDEDWQELDRLERKLHDRDVDHAIREGLAELARTGELERLH